MYSDAQNQQGGFDMLRHKSFSNHNRGYYVGYCGALDFSTTSQQQTGNCEMHLPELSLTFVFLSDAPSALAPLCICHSKAGLTCCQNTCFSYALIICPPGSLLPVLGIFWVSLIFSPTLPLSPSFPFPKPMEVPSLRFHYQTEFLQEKGSNDESSYNPSKEVNLKLRRDDTQSQSKLPQAVLCSLGPFISMKSVSLNFLQPLLLSSL